MNAAAAVGPLCIFQFATKSLIVVESARPSLQRLDPGELALGQELERGAPAGRDVRELLGHSGLMRGLDALSAAAEGTEA